MNMDIDATVRRLTQWLLVDGAACSDLGELVSGFTRRLRYEGVPVDRTFLGPLLLHPQAAGCVVIYEHAGDVVRESELSRERFAELEKQKGTPMSVIFDTAKPMRARLDGTDGLAMADLRSLRTEGYTDFLALPVFCGRTFAAGATVVTRRKGGFEDAHLEVLERSAVPLGPIAMLFVQRVEHGSLLRAYLGADAGRRVQAGQIQRGDGQTIRAAIWFCDMRGFTRLSASHPVEVVLDVINDLFETLVEQIESEQGQVLKFMGDGMLAIFEDVDDAPACENALRAAQSGLVAIDALGKRRAQAGKPVATVGIGLHYGDVLYGNIGAPGRLDFTVMGPAVNLAARIEGMCSSLERAILMSAEFAAFTKADRESCGQHALKGVPAPVEVFTCRNSV